MQSLAARVYTDLKCLERHLQRTTTVHIIGSLRKIRLKVVSRTSVITICMFKTTTACKCIKVIYRCLIARASTGTTNPISLSSTKIEAPMISRAFE